MHAEADDSPSELIHDDHYPVGLDDYELTAEEIDAPKAILAVAEESQPGRAARARFRAELLGRHAANDVLVDIDTEREGDLLCDPSAAEARISPFDLHDGGARQAGRAHVGCAKPSNDSVGRCQVWGLLSAPAEDQKLVLEEQ